MIAFKYSKCDGAEYLSHLDLLRHIYRTFRRAGIRVAMSEGFHAHARIFLNNPLPVGVKSVAEYGSADCDFAGDFKAAFNEFSPEGVKCLAYEITATNPNFANSVEKCLYFTSGIQPFDTDLILNEKSIVITDLRNRQIDIRPRIHSLEFKDGGLLFTAGCSSENLRPDMFCDYLAERFGGKRTEIIKLASYGKGVF